MVKCSISALWAENTGILPGLDEVHRSLYYTTGIGERLCGSCSTERWEAWLDQNQRCASELSYDEIEDLGYVVYESQIPYTYAPINDSRSTWCDGCDQEI